MKIYNNLILQNLKLFSNIYLKILVNDEYYPNYIISSKNLSLLKFEEKIENLKIKKILKSKILDAKWITDSIKVGKLLDTHFYLVFGSQDFYINNINDTENDDSFHKKQSLSCKKPKMENNISKNEKIKNTFINRNYEKNKVEINKIDSLFNEYENNSGKLNLMISNELFLVVNNKEKLNIRNSKGEEQYKKLKSKKSRTNMNSKNTLRSDNNSKSQLSFFKTDSELIFNNNINSLEYNNSKLNKKYDLEKESTKIETIIENLDLVKTIKNIDSTEKLIKKEDNKNQTNKPLPLKENNKFTESMKVKIIDVNLNKENPKYKNKDINNLVKKTNYQDLNENDEKRSDSENKINTTSFIKIPKQFQSDKKTSIEEKEYDYDSFNNIYNFENNIKDKKESKQKEIRNTINNVKISKISSLDQKIKAKDDKIVTTLKFDPNKIKSNKNINLSEEQNSYDDLELSFTEEAKKELYKNSNKKNIFYNFSLTADNNFTDFGFHSKISDFDYPQSNKIHLIDDINNQTDNFNFDENISNTNNKISEKNNPKGENKIQDINSNMQKNYKSNNNINKRKNADKLKFAFYQGSINIQNNNKTIIKQ